jgi:hypothetical protein
MVTESPADHLPREQVDDGHEEEEATDDRQVSRIGDPDVVWRDGREVALEQVGREKA